MHCYLSNLELVIYKRISIICLPFLFNLSFTIVLFAIVKRIFFAVVTNCLTCILYLHLIVKLHLLRVISDIVFSTKIIQKSVFILKLTIDTVLCHALLSKYCKLCHFLHLLVYTIVHESHDLVQNDWFCQF
jgi:hypothetical protein